MSIFDLLKPKKKTQEPKSNFHEERAEDSTEKGDGVVKAAFQPHIVKVADTLQLTAQGVPDSLDEKKRKEVLISLLRNTLVQLPDRSYREGESIYRGKAKLRIENTVYEIVYSLEATRAITALQVYKEAFDAIHAGMAAGVYDEELAELTAEYFKESAWQELLASQNRLSRQAAAPNIMKIDLPKGGKGCHS